MTLTPTTEPTASDAAGILYFLARVKCSQYLLLYIYIYIYCKNWFVEWSLVGERQECADTELFKGGMDSVGECAEACKGVAQMFIFGTNDFGNARCYTDGCNCICETSADDDGTCDIVQHDGYRLYKFIQPSKYSFWIKLHH